MLFDGPRSTLFGEYWPLCIASVSIVQQRQVVEEKKVIRMRLRGDNENLKSWSGPKDNVL